MAKCSKSAEVEGTTVAPTAQSFFAKKEEQGIIKNYNRNQGENWQGGKAGGSPTVMLTNNISIL